MTPNDRTTTKAILQTALALVAIFALADSIAAGAFIAPFLLPFLWLAIAHSVRSWLIPLWVLLTFGCSWLTVVMLIYLTGHESWIDSVSLIIAAVVTTVFFLTALRRSNHRSRESF